MVRSALFILLIVSACTAVSFKTVIGDTSQFGAKITIDTLSCDSLVFSKEIAIDTLKGDSVVYEWSYLRPTISKAVTIYQYDLNFLNHLKIKLQSGIIKNSVIISRQRVIFNNVKYGINDRRKNNSPSFLLSDKQTQLFDCGA